MDSASLNDMYVTHFTVWQGSDFAQFLKFPDLMKICGD